jgi:creatinine amidohydrolase
MTTDYFFQHKSWSEIAVYQQQQTVLLLPVGSTEAHGPHLPLATDAIISETMALRAAAKLTAIGQPALVLPTISYSVTDFSRDFPGSISLSLATAQAVLSEICINLINQGFSYIGIVNSHLEPEHINSIQSACRIVAEATGRQICFPDKRRRRWAQQLTAEFISGACHAGAYETSLVLAAQPQLVQQELQQTLPPVDISLSTAIQAGKQTFREIGGDQAYFGNPAAASVEEGQQSYEILAQMLIVALQETYPDLAPKLAPNNYNQ